MTTNAIRNGVLCPQEQDNRIITAMPPSPCPQSHTANLLPLPDGSLLCVWFGGTQEGITDISVWCSKLPVGGTRRSEAVKLSDNPAQSEQNPVLFLDPENTLRLLWSAQICGNQDTAIARYRQSGDFDKNQGEIKTLLDKPGSFIRQSITVLEHGS